MHQTDGQRYRVGENLLAPATADSGAEDLPDLQRQAIERRLEPKALGRSSEGFKDDAQVASAGIFPRLDGIASVLYANPNTNIFPLRDGFATTWLVGLQASWEINGIPDAIAARRGFQARAAEAQARRRAAEDAVRTEVAQSWLALQDARAASKWSALSLSSADEAYRVRAEIDLRIAAIRLSHATGRDLQPCRWPSLGKRDWLSADAFDR